MTAQVGYDEAAAMLPDGDTVHTFQQPQDGVLLGADWDRDSVLELLRTGCPQLAGELASAWVTASSCSTADRPCSSRREMKTEAKHPLVNGHPVHFRAAQQLVWLGMSILLGAGFIAGLYWLGFQQDYHNLISSLPKGTSAKQWWDSGMGFIHSGRWPVYRHGIRDNGEPALWTMVGATLLGKAKTGFRPLPAATLLAAPFFLLALLVAGALAVAWVINFGPLSHVPNQFSWQNLLLGFILGRVLHIFWAPFGNTIRYHVVAGSLRRGTTPAWVSLPLMPPTWRELWWDMKTKNTVVAVPAAERKRHPARILVPFIVFLFVSVAVIGLLAKYGVAHGARIPVMNP